MYMHMYMYVYMCMYIYIYIYTCIQTHIHNNNTSSASLRAEVSMRRCPSSPSALQVLLTGALYYNKTETDNMLLPYRTGSYVDYNFYNKTDTDNLLADKLIVLVCIAIISISSISVY